MNDILLYILCGCMVACKSGPANNHSSSTDPSVAEIETFTNPLLKSGADPWVIQKDGMYYYTHTTGNSLEIRATERMENLKDATPVTIWKPEPGKSYSRQIWAPELHYLDGKWYIYFAVSHYSGQENSLDENRRMFVLENSSDSPLTDNWEFKGK
jgi:GH43 family beta-xylosidase